MFEHSVKVPRHFKVAANIFKKVSTEGGSVKTLLYDNKLRHFNTNVLFALLTETIKHAADVDKIFEECSLLKNEPRLDPYLAKVLTTELLFGKKKLPGKSKPEQTILSYKEQFEKYASEQQDDSKPEAVRRPRYVRINTNLLTTSDAIRAFQDEGYHFIRCTSGSYDDYLKQIAELTEYDFTQDYHVKTIFVFSAGTKLHDHELYLENKIILQDKATALAVHLLAPPSGSVALDMCAAPGMKTTQLAAFMRNEGKIYAVERNEKRYQTLCDFVERTESKCVLTLHKDALDIKRGDYDDVEYILLDPSCSGSGMELSVHNYIEPSRLAKLTSLQEKFLKHAMNAFPKAKKIVYSTCSLFPEENERVITNIVKASRAKWRVLDVKELLKGQWNNFGSGMYGSIGTRCLYAKPDLDLTTGFFLAVLERDPKDFEKGNNTENVGETIEECFNENGKQETKVKRKKNKSITDEEQTKINSKKKKSKAERQYVEEDNQEGVSINDVTNESTKNKHTTQDLSGETGGTAKKKKKKKKTKDLGQDVSNDQAGVCNEVPKKRERKDKHKSKEVDANLVHETENISQDNGFNDEKPKKKKKYKLNDDNGSEVCSNEIEISVETNEPIAKKNKRNKSSMIETESQETETTELVKKKKKKSRISDANNES